MRGWYKDNYRHSLAARYGSVSVYKKGKLHKTRPGPEVYKLADQVKGRLQKLSSRIDIAGSIRRKSPNPTDIDIVMIPRADKTKVLEEIKAMGGTIERSGNSTIQSRINGVDTDVYFATSDDYGAQMMTRTGPAEGNIGNRTLAKNKGLLLNQYGLYRGKTRIAGKTEKEIYEALGKKYKDPELRGKRQSFDIVRASEPRRSPKSDTPRDIDKINKDENGLPEIKDIPQYGQVLVGIDYDYTPRKMPGPEVKAMMRGEVTVSKLKKLAQKQAEIEERSKPEPPVLQKIQYKTIIKPKPDSYYENMEKAKIDLLKSKSLKEEERSKYKEKEMRRLSKKDARSSKFGQVIVDEYEVNNNPWSPQLRQRIRTKIESDKRRYADMQRDGLS